MKYLLIITALLLGTCLHAQTHKVLFIGNSYTYRNDLPKLIRNVALSTGDTITTEQSTPGGANLSSHTTNANTLAKIASDNWAYVVIQAQSQEPSFHIDQVNLQTFPYAAQLCDSIRANNSCSRPMFYMTWGRENGDQGNCAAWPPICTYEGMDDLLNLRYQMMGEMNDAYVSPVGAVWRNIRTNHPLIDLYDSDGSHPNPTGSYAAACTFYALILQKDPTLISFNANLPVATADQIKLAAKEVAFDSLSKWNVGRYDPMADFTYTQTLNSFSFTNNVANSDSFYWDFGDGNFSTDPDPSHDYLADGTYLIHLIATRCGIIDTASQEVIFATTAVQELAGSPLSIYPNPSSGKIFIKSERKEHLSLRIYSLNGNLLSTHSATEELNLSTLPDGLYLLEIEDTISHQKIVERITLIK